MLGVWMPSAERRTFALGESQKKQRCNVITKKEGHGARLAFEQECVYQQLGPFGVHVDGLRTCVHRQLFLCKTKFKNQY